MPLDGAMSLMNAQFGKLLKCARCATNRLGHYEPHTWRDPAGCDPGWPCPSRPSLLRTDYALRHAKDAFTPGEQLDRALLTQLTFEGLCLDLETVDLMRGESLVRRRFGVCVLFAQPCTSAAETEDQLIAMFAVEGAADEEEGGAVDAPDAGAAAERAVGPVSEAGASLEERDPALQEERPRVR